MFLSVMEDIFWGGKQARPFFCELRVIRFLKFLAVQKEFLVFLMLLKPILEGKMLSKRLLVLSFGSYKINEP